MTTVLVAYAGTTAVLAALLLLVMVVQAAVRAALPVRLRRDVGACAGAALDSVEAAVRQPEPVGSR